MTKDEEKIFEENYIKHGVGYVLKKGMNDWDCVIFYDDKEYMRTVESYRKADIERFRKIDADPNPTMLKTLLDRLPKKYHNRVLDFYQEDGLIDDCRFMLSFKYPFMFCDNDSVPVRSVTKAVRFIKDAYAK